MKKFLVILEEDDEIVRHCDTKAEALEWVETVFRTCTNARTYFVAEHIGTIASKLTVISSFRESQT